MRHHQSGTSVNKPGRISKHGNKYLRRALYMPALSAGTHDPHAAAFKAAAAGARQRRACRSTRRSCARCSPPHGR
ncbi:MAG: transposase [Gammaproteobacteria bacterium]|nr:transposase [Gammaproteobacteria bacterium]